MENRFKSSLHRDALLDAGELFFVSLGSKCMQDKTLGGQGKRFIKGAEAAQYPQFDLLGENRRVAALCATLNRLNTHVADALSVHCRHLFNDTGVQITLSPWTSQGQDAECWLGAAPDNKGEPLVSMGFAHSDLFSLSELFFGGQLAPVKKIEGRQVSETEERLAQKILHSMLGAFFGKLGIKLEGWQSQWHNRSPQQHQVRTELTIKVGEGQLRWQCSWSTDFDPNPQPLAVMPSALKPQLEQCAHAIPVKLKVTVAQLSLSLGELGKLKAGDILPIEMGETVSARIGKVSCLRGQLAEQGDQLVLRIGDGIGETK